MKKLLVTFSLLALFAVPASAQAALDKARQWNDSLIKPKRPITALEQHALNDVILDAVDAANAGSGASVEDYLRSLPGFGEGKVLTVQGGAIIWAISSGGSGPVTYLITSPEGFYLTTPDGDILTQAL